MFAPSALCFAIVYSADCGVRDGFKVVVRGLEKAAPVDPKVCTLGSVHENVKYWVVYSRRGCALLEGGETRGWIETRWGMGAS